MQGSFFREQLAKNDLIAAPMAGISTPQFRKVVRRYHDGLMYSEMISVEGLLRKNERTMFLLAMNDNDAPLFWQLFGKRPESFYDAIRVADECTNAQGYDVNCGCPVKKVINSGAGSHLLRDLPLVKKIASAMRKATEKPLSMKIRLGWDHNTYVYKELLKIAEGEGFDALILHGRTRTDMFGRFVLYDKIAELAALATIPLIGNGNVTNRESYEKMKATGCDGVMIGRGMMKMPWTFAAIHEKRNPVNYLSRSEIYDLLMAMYDAVRVTRPEYFAKGHHIPIIKKYAIWFSKGFPEAAEFRVDLYRKTDEESFLSMVEEFYLHRQEPRVREEQYDLLDEDDDCGFCEE